MSKGFQGAVLKALGAKNHLLAVTEVTDLGPGYRRIGCRAPGLLAVRPVHPTMWIRIWFPAGEGKTVQRAYTLVDPNPDDGTFSLEFALHEVNGPATKWVRTAKPGDALEATVFGGKFALPVPPPKGYLLIGDTASLPAINSILTELPEDLPARVWLESEHAENDELPFAATKSTEVTWIEHTGPDTLRDAVAASAFDASGWFGWVATETKATRALKTLLRQRFNVESGDIKGQAYWIHGRPMGGTAD